MVVLKTAAQNERYVSGILYIKHIHEFKVARKRHLYPMCLPDQVQFIDSAFEALLLPFQGLHESS